MMTPERYQQIDQIFRAALEHEPLQRAGFLDQACCGDETLRQEVETLLTLDNQGLSFIDEPVLKTAASLLVTDEPELGEGERVDRYKVLSLIGSGGMGEVYLAQDEKLNRRIALKLLPSDFTRDATRLHRFQQEARSASALNHPNIITIHEIGQVDDRHFIATEFVDGETLRQRLKRSPLTSGETLDIAIQVCSALAASHQAGIVHRDIKPENIMLRHDGYVKVLDFGLAKLTEQTEATGASHTVEKVDVSSGLVMGTVKYMSPEQARGELVDRRSDIFSFGVVLYEMLSGRTPFEGETANELVAAILKKEPPSLTGLPEEIQRLVRKALHKKSDERYQKIEELLVDLKNLKADKTLTKVDAHAVARGTDRSALPTSETAAISTATTLVIGIKEHRLAALLIVATLFMAAVTIVYVAYKVIRQPKATTSSQNTKLTRVTTSGKIQSAAISPDGKYVAYLAADSGQQSLRLRELATRSDIEILPPGTDIYSAPTFSPDGIYLYFFGKRKDDSGSALYQLPVAGGVARKLLAGSSRYHITFSPDGKRLAFVDENPSESALLVANADGTEEGKLATRKSPDFFWSVSWSPDGKKIACAGGSQNSYDVVEVGIEDGSQKPITPAGWKYIEDVAWLSDGSGLLMTARDQEGNPTEIWHLSPDGQASRITTDLNEYSGLSLSSDSNVLVTRQNNLLMNIWTQPEGDPKGAKQITSGVATRDGLSGISWTPDGRIVYSSFAGGSPDIWVMNPDGSNQKQLTFDLGSDRFGLSVSPDGRYILYVSFRAGTGNANIWRVDIDGNNPKQLTNGSGVELGPFCSPDSNWVFYFTVSSGPRKVSIDGSLPMELTGPYSGILATSPDGRLMAYLMADDRDPATTKKVGIASFENGARITALDQPPTMLKRMQWNPDGSALTYFSKRGGASNIWSLPIDGGPPRQLTDFKADLDIHCFAWSRDGKQLAVARKTTFSDVVLLKNFR